jgi:hypothetical protein
MGLFGKKKKKKEEDELSFEEFKEDKGKLMAGLPELPKYEGESHKFVDNEELGPIKAQITGSQPPPTPLPGIPVRKKPQPSPIPMKGVGKAVQQPMPIQPVQPAPTGLAAKPMPPSHAPVGERPIFVKIEKYREALHNLENIKELCRNANTLLNEINRLREEENRELDKWKEDITKIKDKLLLVDKKLFEG